MTDALKPCPFCGGEAEMKIGLVGFVDCEITCENCGFSGPNFGALAGPDDIRSYQPDAEKHWNTRATDNAELLQTLDNIAGYAAMDPRSSFDSLIIDLVNLAKARAAQ